jgi:hypothetical protein
MSDRPTADAVAAALQERFREQRERGHWFRATPVQVRRAISERTLIELYRPSEAGERAAEREAAAGRTRLSGKSPRTPVKVGRRSPSQADGRSPAVGWAGWLIKCPRTSSGRSRHVGANDSNTQSRREPTGFGCVPCSNL